jgi:DNA-binding MarR family transcriptional regulator
MNWEDTARNWAAPGARGERLRFHDFPVFHLMSLAGAVKHSLVHRYLDPWGLSMPEWRLLSTVAEFTPIRFARIAQLTAMDKAQVSRALRTAQGKGLVDTSIVPAGQDGTGTAGTAGRFHVSITAGGREVYDKVMPLAQRDQLRFIELMTPEERRVILKLAQRMFGLLEGELERDVRAPSFRTAQAELAEVGIELAQPA